LSFSERGVHDRLEDMIEVAIEAAKKGGEALSKYFDSPDLRHSIKEDATFVTAADTEAEEAIVSVITAAFPQHGILGEEGSDTNPNAEFRWVIDPLDGTKNFANGIPIFAVSIGLLKDEEVVVAVVYNPVTRSLYAAERGKGATYNGAPAHVSEQSADMGVITFGPGQKDKDALNKAFEVSEKFFKSKRYLGCAALDLAYVARGGTEAFICIGLKKWDYAAGALLVTEAGGKITDYRGGAWSMEQNYFIASNGVAHAAALKVAVALI
jgi:myo-inositol-1(or 4)-monophosphatase